MAHLGPASEAAADAERQVNKLVKRLAEVEAKEDAMRHDDGFPASMVPPHTGWTLRTKRTLTLGSRIVGPNTEVTPADLALMANSEKLLTGGHIGWTPPRVPRASRPPQSPPPPPPPATPFVPTDHIRVLYLEMVALAEKRHVPVTEVEDVVDRGLWDRAVKQFVDERQMAMSQSWGGNNRPTASGDGTSRRIFDVEAFRKRLYSYATKVEVAA
jgi:hypothetical protein